MARNPYVGQRCAGRHVVTLMREINAIEHVLEQTISHLDVMIIIDISGSMQSTIDAVRAQVSALFTQIIGTHDNIRIGVMQQGVDGDTNNASYARRALIRCQPTRDQAAFQTAMNGFPAADGSGEWYINALRLGITGTTWAADARRMVLTIGDESAAQWRVGTQHNANATEELTAVIGELNAASIIACIICSNANMWPLCEASYMALANGTGGLYLIAPSTEDIVAMIVSMVTQIVITQTTWYRYTKDGQRQSLGAPDGGVNVPALNAIDNMPFVPLYGHGQDSGMGPHASPRVLRRHLPRLRVRRERHRVMCGQAGLILGKKRRTDAEIAVLKTVFSGLLMRSEIRGKHASGVAVVDQDGEYRLFKRPLPATQFMAQPGYADALGAIEGCHGRFAGRSTIILGHTRHRTCGDEANNANNHPLRAADWIGTFNGTIYNATRLFRRHRLYRHAEVDSELVLRLADKFADIGTLDVPRFIDALRSARGQLSAIFASLCAPETAYVLHGIGWPSR